MNTATISNVSKNFRSYIKESKEHPVIIVEGGKPVAVLLPISAKDDMERLSLAYNPKFRKLINEADKRIQKTGGIQHDDFWESLENQGEKAPPEGGAPNSDPLTSHTTV